MKCPSFDGCHDHKHQFEEKLCGFHHIAIILAVAFLKSLILLINRRKGLKILQGNLLGFPNALKASNLPKNQSVSSNKGEVY